jgi:hypothetical protein
MLSWRVCGSAKSNHGAVKFVFRRDVYCGYDNNGASDEAAAILQVRKFKFCRENRLQCTATFSFRCSQPVGDLTIDL